MKKQNPKIIYDKESEVLSLELKKSKSSDSDISGNIVIDYDKKGNVIRVNLYNFSFSNFRHNSKALRDYSKENRVPVLSK